jgi:hypothetical protein
MEGAFVLLTTLVIVQSFLTIYNLPKTRIFTLHDENMVDHQLLVAHGWWYV